MESRMFRVAGSSLRIVCAQKEDHTGETRWRVELLSFGKAPIFDEAVAAVIEAAAQLHGGAHPAELTSAMAKEYAEQGHALAKRVGMSGCRSYRLVRQWEEQRTTNILGPIRIRREATIASLWASMYGKANEGIEGDALALAALAGMLPEEGALASNWRGFNNLCLIREPIEPAPAEGVAEVYKAHSSVSLSLQSLPPEICRDGALAALRDYAPHLLGDPRLESGGIPLAEFPPKAWPSANVLRGVIDAAILNRE